MAISALDTFYSKLPDQSVAQSKDETGLDQFLTLLVAQLQHQDPLNPMEGSDFAVQLAQFSALEQQFKTNDHLENISNSMNTQQAGDLFDYIGRTIKTNDDKVYVENGTSETISYTLADRADVSVTIANADGVIVKTLYEGWRDEGSYVLEWDGKDTKGDTVADGPYTIQLDAVNEQGVHVSLPTFITGEVTGLTYQGKTPYLMVGKQLISPARVMEITAPVEEGETP